MTDEIVPLLKKPEILRDEHGRFEQHGLGLIKKTAKNRMKGKKAEISRIDNIPPEKRQIGRPKGSMNKVTANLKAMILGALDDAGGREYLRKLAVENSSAFAGLLGKILPAVLASDLESDGRVTTKLTFQRVIVWPDGHKDIEGVTPKQIEHRASHVLPSETPSEDEPNDIK